MVCFWFGIRGGRDVHGVAFLPWMLSGIVAWFFISQSLTTGSKSIYSRLNIIAKMNFPMSVIPTFVLFSKFYQHLVLLVTIIIILAFNGYTPVIQFLQLPYIIFANFIFLFSISLVTSTLATIIRDVQMIIQAIVRVLLYLTPILWTPDNLPPNVITLLKVNPIYYITEGYRAALLGTEWYFIDHGLYTIYFWVLIFILFLVGSILHIKFKDRFVDYI